MEGAGVAPEERDVPGHGGRKWVILVVLACLVGVGAWIAHGRQTAKTPQAKTPGGPGAKRLADTSPRTRSPSARQ